jgi:hypothetical protein
LWLKITKILEQEIQKYGKNSKIQEQKLQKSGKQNFKN